MKKYSHSVSLKVELVEALNARIFRGQNDFYHQPTHLITPWAVKYTDLEFWKVFRSSSGRVPIF